MNNEICFPPFRRNASEEIVCESERIVESLARSTASARA